MFANFRAASALLLSLTCAACAPSAVPLPVQSVPQPLAVLPVRPTSFGQPVKVAPPTVKEDARAYAARERQGRLSDERRLADDLAFYKEVEAIMQPQQKEAP